MLNVVVGSDSESCEHESVVNPPVERRGRRAADIGRRCLFLFLATNSGLWHTTQRSPYRPVVEGITPEDVKSLSDGGSHLVGAGVGSWLLGQVPQDPQAYTWLINQVLRKATGIDVFGLVQYFADASACLSDPFPVSGGELEPQDLIQAGRRLDTSGGQKFGAWLEQQQYTCIILVRLCPVLALAAARGLWEVFNVVAITRRTNYNRLFVRCKPAYKQLKRYRLASAPTKHGHGGKKADLKPAWHDQVPVAEVIRWVGTYLSANLVASAPISEHCGSNVVAETYWSGRIARALINPHPNQI